MTAVELDRTERVRQVVDQVLRAQPDVEERRCGFVHLYGVAQACALLARARGLDAELSTIAGMLHDLWTYKSGDPTDHARRSATMARQILSGLACFAPPEIDTICAACPLHAGPGTGVPPRSGGTSHTRRSRRCSASARLSCLPSPRGSGHRRPPAERRDEPHPALAPMLCVGASALPPPFTPVRALASPRRSGGTSHTRRSRRCSASAHLRCLPSSRRSGHWRPPAERRDERTTVSHTASPRRSGGTSARRTHRRPPAGAEG
ncbi:MAG: HD domain-containing protein, partial [Anaerolineae bacterium]|nr:HD domain-containing protein [Anaerolineae bacterium]